MVVRFISAWNGNLEVPAHFLKAKQGYTVRKTDIVYIGKFRYEIQEKKKFLYAIPAISSTGLRIL
jgi:hypothetical protein